MAPSDPYDAGAGDSPEPPVSAERWRTIQRIVDGVLDRPEESRTSYLDEACGGDAALRAAVLSLVEACERAAGTKGLLDQPAMAFAAPLLAEDPGGGDDARTAIEDRLRQALAGRYRVEREVGRGGSAIVYLAHDLRHDRAVAVKVLDRGVAHHAAARFLQEIRTAAGLTHPHIVSIHDSGEADGLLYSVMPYVAGETLRARLDREGRLPLGDAIRLLRELAGALACAHERGVVHRDLKPENVLLSSGHAVIVDFGIAKALAAATQHGEPSTPALTATGTALGTPAYMAPEQAVGVPAVDQRADLYALGVIAYEVLTGSHPFGVRAPPAMVAAHLTETPAPVRQLRPEAPLDIAALVEQLLAKDPAARLQSADAVLRVLDRTTAVPQVATGRRGRIAIGIAVATALIVMTGAYAAWRGIGPTSGPPVAVERDAIRSIAVLPFLNTGGIEADDYFSDGMTDELAHALARIPGVRVAGRTSSYAFKGTAMAAQEIGRSLGVGAIVNGTVRRSGERLRVMAQLVSTADGKVMWDSVFESRTGDVFTVQDEFTGAIVAALGPTLGTSSGARTAAADQGRGTTDQEAYDLYLKGRYHWLLRGTANVALAIEYFRRATVQDPAFARAHAGLALAYLTLSSYVQDPGDSAWTRVTASAVRAMQLDSTIADSHLAFGAALEGQRRFGEGLMHYRRALEIEPSNQFAYHVLGFALMNIGRNEEAVVELRRASQLDPLAKSAGTALAGALLSERRFPEAMDEARRVLALDSTFPLATGALAMAQAFGGQPDSALLTLDRSLRLHPPGPGFDSLLLFAYAAAGRWDDAERIRARLQSPGGDVSGGVDAAVAELVFGDPEPLVRLMSTHDGQIAWMDTHGGFGCNPFLDPLWSDARFRAAMGEVGVTACPHAGPWQLPPRHEGRAVSSETPGTGVPPSDDMPRAAGTAADTRDPRLPFPAPLTAS